MSIDEVEWIVTEVHGFSIIDALAVGDEILMYEITQVHFTFKTAFFFHIFA